MSRNDDDQPIEIVIEERRYRDPTQPPTVSINVKEAPWNPAPHNPAPNQVLLQFLTAVLNYLPRPRS